MAAGRKGGAGRAIFLTATVARFKVTGCGAKIILMAAKFGEMRPQGTTAREERQARRKAECRHAHPVFSSSFSLPPSALLLSCRVHTK